MTTDLHCPVSSKRHAMAKQVLAQCLYKYSVCMVVLTEL